MKTPHRSDKLPLNHDWSSGLIPSVVYEWARRLKEILKSTKEKRVQSVQFVVDLSFVHELMCQCGKRKQPPCVYLQRVIFLKDSIKLNWTTKRYAGRCELFSFQRFGSTPSASYLPMFTVLETLLQHSFSIIDFVFSGAEKSYQRCII